MKDKRRSFICATRVHESIWIRIRMTRTQQSRQIWLRNSMNSWATTESPASCPNCGISFNEFRESGRFGCSQDYTEFMTELLPLLENIHEEVEHKGKRPRSTVVGTQEQGQLIQLRNAQRNAIEEEDYETAARLRDEIAALENALREDTPKKTRRKKKSAPPE